MVVLPAPVGPTMATVWPGFGGEADITQHRLVRHVCGVDVVELDFAAEWRACGSGVRLVL